MCWVGWLIGVVNVGGFCVCLITADGFVVEWVICGFVGVVVDLRWILRLWFVVGFVALGFWFIV